MEECDMTLIQKMYYRMHANSPQTDLQFNNISLNFNSTKGYKIYT